MRKRHSNVKDLFLQGMGFGVNFNYHQMKSLSEDLDYFLFHYCQSGDRKMDLHEFRMLPEALLLPNVGPQKK